jgi:hypothetical protein
LIGTEAKRELLARPTQTESHEGHGACDAADLRLARELGFDESWIAALRALRQVHANGEVVLAPAEFAHFFDKTYPIHIRRRVIPDERIDWFLLHSAMGDRIDPAVAQEGLGLHPHFANEVFVLLGRREGELPDNQRVYLAPFASWAKDLPAREKEDAQAAMIKAFGRPSLLEPCLASIADQFDRLLVVDDGSNAGSRSKNQETASRFGAEYLSLRRNRGVACAYNVGLLILFSELEIEWISIFDDDVNLAAGGAARLRSVTQSLGPTAANNLYSGYASPKHRIERETLIGGERVSIYRSCSGQHMHAHRSYWEGIVPIPTAYPRAPKLAGGLFPGHGSDTDWWCSNWAPRSVMKRGGSVYVLPGLVTTRGSGRSTWGGPGV